MKFLYRQKTIVLLLIIHSLLLTSASAHIQQQSLPQVTHRTGSNFAPLATRQVEPAYPPIAKAAGVSGSVVVEVSVDKAGKILSARALSGHPLLKDSAVAAMYLWEFAPTERATLSMVTFTFELPDDAQNSQDLATDLEKAQQAAIANPYSPEVQYWLGEAYQDEELTEKAIAAFNKAIELKPDYERAYSELASLYREENQLEAAIQTYKRAIEAIPQSLDMMRNLASLLERNKRYAEGVEVLKKFLAIKSDDERALNQIGFFYHRLRRFDEARESVLKAINLKPDFGRAYHTLGATYLEQGRYEEALAAYAKLSEVEPNYGYMQNVYVEIARSYMLTKRYLEAIDTFKKLIELKPDFYEAYCGMGEAYAMLNRLEEAIDIFKKTLEKDPNNACARNDLSVANMKLGQSQEAEKNL